MNKSYEEEINDENNSLNSYRNNEPIVDVVLNANRNTRSKSIYAVPKADSPEILIVESVDGSNY